MRLWRNLFCPGAPTFSASCDAERIPHLSQTVACSGFSHLTHRPRTPGTRLIRFFCFYSPLRLSRCSPYTIYNQSRTIEDRRNEPCCSPPRCLATRRNLHSLAFKLRSSRLRQPALLNYLLRMRSATSSHPVAHSSRFWDLQRRSPQSHQNLSHLLLRRMRNSPLHRWSTHRPH